MTLPTNVPEGLENSIAAGFLNMILDAETNIEMTSYLTIAKALCQSWDKVMLGSNEHSVIIFSDNSLLDILEQGGRFILRIGQHCPINEGKPIWAEKGKTIAITNADTNVPEGHTTH